MKQRIIGKLNIGVAEIALLQWRFSTGLIGGPAEDEGSISTLAVGLDAGIIT